MKPLDESPPPVAADPPLAGAELIRRVGLRKIMAEDYRTHRREFFMPGLHAVWINRIGTWSPSLPRFVRAPFYWFYLFGHWFCKAVYGIELENSVKLGRRFQIGHQGAIVIHKHATFGDDCVVRQGVTFGMSNVWEPGVGPEIGNNVSFAPGSIMMGNIRIGDNVQVGPNCVVTTDVPADRVLFVTPPRVFPRNAEQEVSIEEKK